MIRLTALKLRLAKGDDGIAIIMVIGISLVLMLLVTVALGVSLSGMTKSKNDERVNGAIAAAYAGIEDYKSKIANDNNYYRYGNPASLFSKGNPAVPATVSNVALPPASLSNPALGVAPSDTWATVNGTGSSATYRYEVDNSKYSSSGVLRIRSTGRVGTETRTVVADLRQKGFIDFLYYTTFEIQDPDISGSNVSTCVVYAWAANRPVGNGSNSGPCSDIAFGGSDFIRGPVHSNDTIRACGATFDGVVTTGSPIDPATGLAYKRKDSNNSNCSGGTSETFTKGKPVTAPTVDLPPTNSAMRNEARTDLPDTVPDPGCLYTGPTKIVFNSGGTMTVRSPWTKATRVAGDPASSSTANSACGVPGPDAGQLGSAGGQTINVLPRNLIFVQNVKFNTSLTSDPNVWKTNTYPSSFSASTCGSSNGLGYPISQETVASVATSYGCSNGDIFVEGNVNAEMTLAAENYVYVTGDIKYVSTNANAVLGLVAQNAVWVWNPVKCTGYNSANKCISASALSGSNRQIDAAIASVKHTFQVQNYDLGGSKGTLTINGAIAQKFRGIVRSGSNGYAKNYIYDDRFRYLAPPKFLSPVQTTYGVTILVEVKTAYTAAGESIP